MCLSVTRPDLSQRSDLPLRMSERAKPSSSTLPSRRTSSLSFLCLQVPCFRMSDASERLPRRHTWARRQDMLAWLRPNALTRSKTPSPPPLFRANCESNSFVGAQVLRFILSITRPHQGLKPPYADPACRSSTRAHMRKPHGRSAHTTLVLLMPL